MSSNELHSTGVLLWNIVELIQSVNCMFRWQRILKRMERIFAETIHFAACKEEDGLFERIVLLFVLAYVVELDFLHNAWESLVEPDVPITYGSKDHFAFLVK